MASGIISLLPIGLSRLVWEEVDSVITPEAQYTIWADDIGVSDIGSDLTLDGDTTDDDDEAYRVQIGGSLVKDPFLEATWSTEGGFGFHTLDPIEDNISVQITIPNIERMYALGDTPDLFYTFHPVALDAQLDNSKHRVGITKPNVSIFFGVHGDWDDISIGETHFAMRVEDGLVTMLMQVIDGSIDHYINLYDQFDPDNLVAQELMFTQTVGTTKLLTLIFNPPIFNPNFVVVRNYTCVITGAADSLPNVTIPISSINMDLTSNGPSSITIVNSDGVNYAQAITDRSKGGIIITTTDFDLYGLSDSLQSDEFGITSLTSSEGASSFSVAVSGQVTVVNAVPKTITPKKISFQSTNVDGDIRVRIDPDKSLLPGDTIVINASNVLVDRIALNVSQSGVITMEVSSG